MRSLHGLVAKQQFARRVQSRAMRGVHTSLAGVADYGHNGALVFPIIASLESPESPGISELRRESK